MSDGLSGVPLDGGVASDVRVVETDDGPIVVKRALPKLKVEADWFSDPARSLVEVAAIEAFGKLAGPGVVPEVIWSRPDEHCFAMRLVDPALRTWKGELLAGRIDVATARRVGTILGQFHSNSAHSSELAARFDDLGFFRELRLEPFFAVTAHARPQLAPQILGTADALVSQRSALVHGDYSPKNILARGSEVVILDFEVAHWGNPRFDVAYCLAHLMLKSALLPEGGAKVGPAITAFLEGYEAHGVSLMDALLAHVTGCLLLARIFGKSPVEYRHRLDVAHIEDRAVALLNKTKSPSAGELRQHMERNR